MTTTYPEPRKKKEELSEWLKKINEIEPCSQCGMIAGSCPFYGDKCPTHPSNREKEE